MAKATRHKEILVYAGWKKLSDTTLMGTLQAEMVRGREIFSFAYSNDWLEKGRPYFGPGLAGNSCPYRYPAQRNTNNGNGFCLITL